MVDVFDIHWRFEELSSGYVYDTYWEMYQIYIGHFRSSRPVAYIIDVCIRHILGM